MRLRMTSAAIIEIAIPLKWSLVGQRVEER